MEIRGGPRSGLVRLRDLKAGDCFLKVNPDTKEPIARSSVYMKTQISPEEKEETRWRQRDRVRCVTLRTGSWSYQDEGDEVLVVVGFFQIEGTGADTEVACV